MELDLLLSNKFNINNIFFSSNSDRADSANIKSISVNLIKTATFHFSYKQNRAVIGTATFNRVKYKFQK